MKYYCRSLGITRITFSLPEKVPPEDFGTPLQTWYCRQRDALLPFGSLPVWAIEQLYSVVYCLLPEYCYTFC
jgi:hypothetical protein